MNDDELLRYSRQILLPEIGIEGQEKLLSSSILIIGLGGLGSPAAMYLAAAGVGHLILADIDTVDLSNLQRQIIHTTDRVGELKTRSARQGVTALNPATRVSLIEEQMDTTELDRQVAASDLVLDCTDNFTIRFSINRACIRNRTPLVSGAAIRLEGQILVIDPRVPESPCYRCLYQPDGNDMPSCAENGVAAPVTGMIGTMQAMEAIKLIAGFGETLTGRLLIVDAKTMDCRKLILPRNPSCPECGE